MYVYTNALPEIRMKRRPTTSTARMRTEDRDQRPQNGFLRLKRLF